MKLADLQPLDKVVVCRHAIDEPGWMVNVDHRDAGDLDLLCNHRHTIDDITWMHAAHLGIAFPQIRTLEEVPLGQTAAYQDGAWVLRPLPYEEGDSPGDLPPPPDPGLTLAGWTHTCACCGETRQGLGELAFRAPVQVQDAQGDPAYEILEHGSDLCRIRIEGETHYFIRGLLPIPIPEARDTYAFGVWSTVSEENFRRYSDTFDGEQRDLGSMFGYLSNAVPGVPNSIGMMQSIVPGRPGRRPWLILWEPEAPHPLHTAQQEGATVARLLDWVGPHLQCGGAA